MVKVCDIAQHIEKLAPCHYAAQWDNVGLIVGDCNKEVKIIMCTLDVDIHVVCEAVKNNVDMIISHHPLMFEPINRLIKQDAFQNVLMELVKNDISLYSAHTNLDVTVGGLNDLMAKKLNLLNTKVLEVVGCENGKEYGFGRFCELEKPKKLSYFLKECKDVFGIKVLRYCGNDDTLIKKVAINTGGGTSAMDKCFENDIDLFITGDFKYNAFREAYEKSLCVIDAGHYNTEIIVKELFENYIKKQFPNIKILQSEENIDIIKIYE